LCFINFSCVFVVRKTKQRKEKMSAKQKALEKKELNEAGKKKKADDEKERAEASAWEVGARDNAKQRAEEEKEAARRQKANEKAMLEAQEETELGNVKKIAKTKKKGKDDFDMLKAALASQPKTKAQKEAEEKKRQEEERKKKEQEARERKEAEKQKEEEMRKKAAAKGIVVDHADHLFVPLNNRLEDENDFEHGTGLDAAMDLMTTSLGGAKMVDEHPERRQKAMYNAFYDATLPRLKEELPGLKLSQYKERIFDMWKTSPENPRNQKGYAPSSTAAEEEY
jgi:chemotaxis protein histidine kinase CheA